MIDLKPTNPRKARSNRRKKEKQPVAWRAIFHRVLMTLVVGVSAVLIVGGCLLGTRVLLASDRFHVDQVQVLGQQRLTAEEVVAQSNIRLGQSIFALDLVKIGRKIEENPWVRTTSVRRIFPRQVVLQVEERTPVAVINLGYLYYVDRTGDVFKVLSREDALDFPMITGLGRQEYLQDPEAAGQRLREVVALIEHLAGRSRFSLEDVAEIHLDADGGLSLFTYVGAVPVRLGQGQYAGKLDRLERVYKELEPRLSVLKGIDLAVADRVIVTLPEKSPSRS